MPSPSATLVLEEPLCAALTCMLYDQVRINYGDKSNEELLLLYGALFSAKNLLRSG